MRAYVAGVFQINADYEQAADGFAILSASIRVGTVCLALMYLAFVLLASQAFLCVTDLQAGCVLKTN
jgi:hypothetical protein